MTSELTPERQPEGRYGRGSPSGTTDTKEWP